MTQPINEQDKELDKALQDAGICMGILQTPAIYRHDGFFERKDGKPLEQGEPWGVCDVLERRFDGVKFEPVVATKRRHFTIDARPNPEGFGMREYLIDALSDMGFDHVAHSKGVENCRFYIPARQNCRTP